MSFDPSFFLSRRISEIASIKPVVGRSARDGGGCHLYPSQRARPSDNTRRCVYRRCFRTEGGAMGEALAAGMPDERLWPPD